MSFSRPRWGGGRSLQELLTLRSYAPCQATPYVGSTGPAHRPCPLPTCKGSALRHLHAVRPTAPTFLLRGLSNFTFVLQVCKAAPHPGTCAFLRRWQAGRIHRGRKHLPGPPSLNSTSLWGLAVRIEQVKSSVMLDRLMLLCHETEPVLAFW